MDLRIRQGRKESPFQSGVLAKILAAGLIFFGAATRIYLFFSKPLWADEIYTLWLVRLSPGETFRALALDSGPPLHYLLTKLFLFPFPQPGSWDIIVRLPSLLASLVTIPLLVRLGRDMGNPAAGWGASVLFSLSPLAAGYAAEGRAYAWSSLLCLVAAALSVKLSREGGRLTALALGTVITMAFLSHYLTLFVLGGILLAFTLRYRERLTLWILAAAAAATLAAPWIPVLLKQPRAAMEWEQAEPFASKAGTVLTNVILGVPVSAGFSTVLLLLATSVLGLSFFLRKQVLPQAAGAVLIGLVLLLAGSAIRPEILLPERTAIAFLPLVFLTLASLGLRTVSLLSALLLASLLSALPSWTRPLPIQQLAEQLVPAVKNRHGLGVAGIWGPEIRYWFERQGVKDSVRYFPGEMERHPGWYAESGLKSDELQKEARAFLREPSAPRLLLLPIGYRASEALRQEALTMGGETVAATPLFDIIRIPVLPSRMKWSGSRPPRQESLRPSILP